MATQSAVAAAVVVAVVMETVAMMVEDKARSMVCTRLNVIVNLYYKLV